MLTVDIQSDDHYFWSCKENKLGTKSAVFLKALLPGKFCILPCLTNEQVTITVCHPRWEIKGMPWVGL